MNLNLPKEYPREQWFRATPIFIFFPSLIVIYAFSGFYFQHFNGILARYLSPIINGLGLIGVDIAPVLIGPLDPIFYRNLSGISFMGALAYNFASLAYIAWHRRAAALSCVDAHALLMKRKQWGAKKAWVILHLYVYVGLSALGVFMTLGLLNSIFHWQVFATDRSDILKVCLVSIYFCFLGMTPVYLFSVCIKYVIFDVAHVLKNNHTK